MSPYNGPIERVIIAGGGTAGWMTAAALSKALMGLSAQIILVESEEIGTIGVGEATIPVIHAFNNMLGLSQADFMRSCHATFKLGIEFVDWGRLGSRYIHPFTAYGRDHENLSFHELWLKFAKTESAAGRPCRIDDYNLCCAAALAGRFSHPVFGQNTGNAPLNYAFHFDANLYARYLRSYSEERGVVRLEGKIADVRQEAESGRICALVMESGQALQGDLFIDCTGLRGLLIEKTLKTGFDDWTRWLPCNRAIAVPSASAQAPVPFTRSTADAAGWRWRIPLQTRIGNGYVYSDSFLDDDAAEAGLLSQLDGEALGAPRRIRFTTGCRRLSWNGNCVAIGLAAGFMEPLESTSIHLIHTAILRLLAYFPDKALDPVEIREFNRQTTAEYERIRDFLILHYKATKRDDTAFWRHCQNMAVPDSLAHKMELFQSKGRIMVSGDELFTAPSWISVMLGQASLPSGYDPLVDKIPSAELTAFMNDVKGRIDHAVAAMPTHSDYIRQYCASEQGLA